MEYLEEEVDSFRPARVEELEEDLWQDKLLGLAFKSKCLEFVEHVKLILSIILKVYSKY